MSDRFALAGFAVECHIGTQGGTIHGSVEVFDMSGNDTFTPLDGVFASGSGQPGGNNCILFFFVMSENVRTFAASKIAMMCD